MPLVLVLAILHGIGDGLLKFPIFVCIGIAFFLYLDSQTPITDTNIWAYCYAPYAILYTVTGIGTFVNTLED